MQARPSFAETYLIEPLRALTDDRKSGRTSGRR
jgi:hypothetical protein